MLKISVWTGLLFGIFLALAEAARNWGNWQWWPFWTVDYMAAALLVIGAILILRGGAKHWLVGGWGFTTAMFWGSFWSHVASVRAGSDKTYGPDGATDESTLTVIIGSMLAIAVIGFIFSLFGKTTATSAD